MQRAHGGRHAVGLHDAGDLDRRGGDHLDVDVLVAEGAEHLGGDARMRLHSRADDRDLPHRRILGHAEDPDRGDNRVERGAGGRKVGARAVKIWPAMPGLSGTPRSVTRASSVEWVTAVMSGRSMVSSSPTTKVPGP